MLPVLLFGAAFGGVPFVPINYRLADDRLRDLVARNAPALMVVDPPVVERLGRGRPASSSSRGRSSPTARARAGGHRRRAGWGCGRGDRRPPVHVAARPASRRPPCCATATSRRTCCRHQRVRVAPTRTRRRSSACRRTTSPGSSAILSAVYAGRRLVYLPAFIRSRLGAPRRRDEAITHAMVVPTMLGRILDVLEATATELPALRAPLLRRRPHAACRSSSGRWALLPARELRQRLRPDRDQLHDRRARTRRPPRGRRQRGSGRAGPARVGRPAAAHARAGDPRPRRRPGADRRGRRDLRARRAGRRRVPRPRATAPTTAGSRPATAATSTRTDTCSSRAASTTSSSAAARTSRPGEIEEVLLPHPAVDRGRRGRHPRRRVGRARRRRGRAAHAVPR